MCENNLEYRMMGEGKQVLVLETGIGNSFYSWLPFVDVIKNDFTVPEEEALLHEKVWRELQVELARLSEKGRLVIAEGSDHEVHKDQPDIVMACLQRLIEGQVPRF
ncbi:hypothetical protein [Rossellomorea vietnamensis]|uniref:hypothetical protein n=1 Tax=Rossellomorea vietnamensis TaxID=218284 RepID=UPI001E2D10C1|nr:hypothetical protein [Rossellomorea vietnamensis]MCC5803533.1 hypothetical protein [Rossellomorea vietnamensis]